MYVKHFAQLLDCEGRFCVLLVPHCVPATWHKIGTYVFYWMSEWILKDGSCSGSWVCKDNNRCITSCVIIAIEYYGIFVRSVWQHSPDAARPSVSFQVPLCTRLWAFPGRYHMGLTHILSAQPKVWSREEASKNSDEQLNLTYVCTILYHLWGSFTPVVFGITNLVTTKDILVIYTRLCAYGSLIAVGPPVPPVVYLFIQATNMYWTPTLC